MIEELFLLAVGIFQNDCNYNILKVNSLVWFWSLEFSLYIFHVFIYSGILHLFQRKMLQIVRNKCIAWLSNIFSSSTIYKYIISSVWSFKCENFVLRWPVQHSVVELRYMCCCFCEIVRALQLHKWCKTKSNKTIYNLTIILTSIKYVYFIFSLSYSLSLTF